MSTTPEYKERLGSCAHCGNSPTPHLFAYLLSTSDIWGAKMAYHLSRLSFFSVLLNLVGHGSYRLERFNYDLMRRLGIITFGTDVTKARSYRSQVVWEEAMRRGIPMEQLVVFGSASDVYRAQIRGEWVYFESLPIPDYFRYGAYLWMDDKARLNAVLRNAGVPVPELRTVTTRAAACAAFQNMGGRVVTKPRAGSRGRHTTTNIRGSEELEEAFLVAKQLCRYVCITRHVDGGVCRGTVVGGRLVGFFEAHTPRVVGNGVSTLIELVEKKNAERPARVQSIELREEHEAYIRRAGYIRESVLPDGEVLTLTHRTGRLFGGETRELLSSVHPKLRKHLERAAAALSVPIVGFDLIIQDPEADPDTQEWGIIEANSLPFIDLHYLPLYGEPSNVAAAVWDLWNMQRPG